MRCLVVYSALLAIWFSLVNDASAQESKAYVFRGVEPGVTTAAELFKNERWGKPAKRQLNKDGSIWLEYQIRGYRKVGVLVRGPKVQTIDVTLPDGLQPDAVGSALKLGKPASDDALPPTAMAGPAIPQALEAVSYADRQVVLYVDGKTGNARQLRAYADRMLTVASAGSTSENPPAPDDDSESPAAATATGLKGQDATSRQAVMASTKMLAKYHISRHPVDDEIGKRTLQAFLKALDPMKMYLVREDIAPYMQRYDMIDDQLRGGDLKTFYEIFRLYIQRVDQRVALIEKLIEADHDFSVDEAYQAGSENAAYAENELEVNELWRKRAKYELLTHKAAGADLAEAKRRVRQRYRLFSKQIHARTDNDLMETVLTSLAGAYDPHSSYISERKYQDFQIGNAAQLYGIGASLQMVDGYVTVAKIVPQGPADRDGRLKAGDRILSVDSKSDGKMVDVINARLPDAVSMMRGKDGTKLSLLVMPKGEFETSVYELTRGRVLVQSIGHTILTGEQLPSGRQSKVGFLYLPTFYRTQNGQKETEKDFRSTTRDMQKILADFNQQKVDLVVLDVRTNGGGSLTEAINLPGLFIEGEPLTLQVKDGNGQVRSYTAKDIDDVWKGPLVVLTSRFSAGGSEILAGAIQDYQRGIVIGDAKTHGLGTVANAQNMGRILFGKTMPNPPKLGYLKLVIQKFYRPSGDSTQLRGIVPDLVLPSIINTLNRGEDKLPYALKFDRVSPAKFTKLTGYAVSDRLRKTLAERSEGRRTGSEYFQKLASRSDTASVNVVSLNAEKFLAARKSTSDKDQPKATLPNIPDVKLDGYLKEALAVSLDYSSRALYAQAEKFYAAKQYGPAMTRYESSVAADPNSTTSRYKYAWVLATCPSTSRRNGKLAVTHATKACELDEWNKWHYLLALAVSHAEAGQFADARKHLKAALDKAPAGDKATYRFLEQRFEQNQPYQLR